MAVDGTLVVGSSQLRTGHSHAFFYDLAASHPALVDINTLTGWRGTTEAFAVEDGIVVGDVVSLQGLRGFVLDTQAAQPRLVPLTPAGQESHAAAIGNGVVVGWAVPVGGGPIHAFAYDTRAATPTLRDLGTLGGERSQALAVTGHLVLGGSMLRDGREHAFVYDLDAAVPHMIDVSPDAQWSFIEAVHGTVAVGAVMPGRQSKLHEYVMDLSTTPPTMSVQPHVRKTDAIATDGTLLVTTNEENSYIQDLAPQSPLRRIGRVRDLTAATDIDNGLIVGHQPSHDWSISGHRAFVYDANAADPQVVQLPRAAGSGTLQPVDQQEFPFQSDVTDLDGLIAVGQMAVRGQLHAALWELRREPSATIWASNRPGVRAQEGHDAVITIHRSGPTEGSAAVRYRVSLCIWGPASDCAASSDVGARHGRAHFRPGQHVARIRLPILHDTTHEQRETLWVLLGDAKGAMLTPDVVIPVYIRRS